MFQDFPSLHPLAIHFPIVLILLATAFQAVLVFKDWDQIRWVTLYIMASAFFSALAASTLFHADPSEDAPKEAMKMFEEHERFAQLTLWMSGITLLLKCIGVFFKITKNPFCTLLTCFNIHKFTHIFAFNINYINITTILIFPMPIASSCRLCNIIKPSKRTKDTSKGDINASLN